MTTTAPTRKPAANTPAAPLNASRWRVFWVAFALLFGMIGCWAFASPLMSSPDEPSHAIRAAAVVRGDLTGTPDPSGVTTDVVVPKYLADSRRTLACFSFHPELSAKCQAGTADNELAPGTTESTLNTPVFYAVVGVPTLFLKGNIAIYAMRMIVVLLSSALLALMFMMLSQLPRARWTFLAGAVAVTPMVMFLSGSINPNAIEASASMALYASLLVIFRTPVPSRRHHLERIAVVVLSTFFLVNTRSISLIWLLIIVVISLIYSKREILVDVFRNAITWVGVVLAGLAVAGAGIWYLLPKGLVQISGLETVGRTPGWAFSTMIDRTLEDGRGWVGIFGWGDTASPEITYVIWGAAVLGLVLAAMAVGSRTGRIAILLWAFVLFIVPAVIQAVLVTDWGLVWQGRYSIALFVCLIVTAGFVIDDRSDGVIGRATGRAITIGLAVVAFGDFAAFVWALRRNVVGLDPLYTWVHMFTQPQWQPPVSWILLSAVFAVLLAASVLALRKATVPRLR